MLTFKEFGYIDDVLSDCLVDKVYYWSTTRKVHDDYKPLRGVPQCFVKSLIRDDLIHTPKPDVNAATRKFVDQPAMFAFVQRFRKNRAMKFATNESVKAEMEKHTRRYLSMYLTDCPFQIEVTNRYARHARRHCHNPEESCVISRANIPAGQTIQYLTGHLLELSEDDEESLNSMDKDFSIITTSRLGGSCLMLGPARFVNHDCNANAQFVSSGPRDMLVQALRDVPVGHEITVKYADSYFGSGNRHCLCSTCESLQRNGFDKHRMMDDSSDEAEDDNDLATNPAPIQLPTPPPHPLSPSRSSEEAMESRAICRSINSEDEVLSPVLAGNRQPASPDREALGLLSPDGSSGDKTRRPSRVLRSQSQRAAELEKLRKRQRRQERLKKLQNRASTKSPRLLRMKSAEFPALIGKDPADKKKLSLQELLNLYYTEPNLPGKSRTRKTLSCEACQCSFHVSKQMQESLGRSREPRYCHRCERHALLYDAPWPSMERTNDIQVYNLSQANSRSVPACDENTTTETAAKESTSSKNDGEQTSVSTETDSKTNLVANTDSATTSTSRRGRGRPRLSESSKSPRIQSTAKKASATSLKLDTVGAPRKRGRPRKNPLPDIPNEPSVPRPRGRPRKQAAVSPKPVSSTPRRRGRPRKEDYESDRLSKRLKSQYNNDPS